MAQETPVLNVTEIEKRLRPLLGLKIAIARRAADMRCFHFGQVRPVTTRTGGTGLVGEYALHVQCPWRIEGPDGIVTGRSDLWEPADGHEEIDLDCWDYDKNSNLQDERIANWLRGYDCETRSAINETNKLVVERIEADDCGGVRIELMGEYRLLLFPDGSQSEDWRLLSSNPDEPHFVIVGGKIET